MAPASFLKRQGFKSLPSIGPMGWTDGLGWNRPRGPHVGLLSHTNSINGGVVCQPRDLIL